MAALFYLHVKDFEKARQCLKRSLESAPREKSLAESESRSFKLIPGSPTSFAYSVMGWVDLLSGSELYASKSISWFDKVLESDPRDLDALFGRMFYLRLQRRQPTPALDITSQIIVYFPNFVPAYIERMYILLEMGAWDQVTESAQRLSSISPENIDATTSLCLVELYLDPEEIKYKVELGYIQFLSGNLKQAKECFEVAGKKDSNNQLAIQGVYDGLLNLIGTGLIRCLIYTGDITAAEEQLEFYEALCATGSSGDIPLTLIAASEILEELLKVTPGVMEALYYQARVKYLMGDPILSQNIALKCLRLDPSFVKAIQSLEMALSYNFEVRQMLIFHLLKAKALKLQGQYEDSLKVLQHAATLPVVRELSEDDARRPKYNISEISITQSEHVDLYLELADIHTKLKNAVSWSRGKSSKTLQHEAAKAIEDALRRFRGTKEMPKIILANAELLLSSGEVDAALKILGEITPDQDIFIEARKKMANVYLQYKNDRKAYAKCYSEIIDQIESAEAYLLLGDAFMNIQEPKKAIEVYKKALDTSPGDISVACKLGKAFVRVHDYEKAIKYYENALSRDSSGSPALRYDLAELYYKLKNFEDAERVALEAIESREGLDNLLSDLDVRCYKLLAKIYLGLNALDKALQTLQKAKNLQFRLLAKSNGSIENTNQKIMASDICYDIAELYIKHLKDFGKAVEYYNEAIQNYSMHSKSLLALAKIYIQQGDINAAQNQCTALLRLDPSNEDATIMIADIMFRKNSFSSALFHFRQLLDKNPTNYRALKQLIEMMRRAGKLEEAEKFFESAEKASSKSNLHAGYHFCKGLYLSSAYKRYTNSPNEALKEFNACRRDTEWGEESLSNMIEIFLNPDNETLGGDALETVNDDSASPPIEKAESDVLAILTADKLIKELPTTTNSTKRQIYECYALMATKQKADIEKALGSFTEILTEQKEHVPALLPPRARNQLKRVAKMEWVQEFESDFEKAWLLLADIHIQGGKYDLATELLKKVLAQNKSCAKAWEYLGFIMEKEASYKDAAENYENSWKLERESNPSIGYKLAFNYLKAKRNVEAIEVCHKILQMYPDYPKIRKEVLEKARSLLRI
ncbi:Tetratricopeptide repeat protein 21B [Phlyctochytrium bullatum]|nr:Tetratricopeptide repeat protein 21B [Phlyctochytrium bullatum]